MGRVSRFVVRGFAIFVVGASAAVGAASLETEPTLSVDQAQENFDDALSSVQKDIGETVLTGIGLGEGCAASSTRLFSEEGQTPTIGEALSPEGIPGCGTEDAKRIKTVEYVNSLATNTEQLEGGFAEAAVQLDAARSSSQTRWGNVVGKKDVGVVAVIAAFTAQLRRRQGSGQAGIGGGSKTPLPEQLEIVQGADLPRGDLGEGGADVSPLGSIDPGVETGGVSTLKGLFSAASKS